MNRRVFAAPVRAPVVRNNAGGKAYALNPESALCQLVLTGCFNDTFYVKAEKQVDDVLSYAAQCTPEFVAKLAVYARTEGYMKDAPTLLLAHLLTRDSTRFNWAFERVCDNARMVRGFVQIIRSGVVGRKSLGTVGKKAVQRWFAQRTANELFKQSVGNDPSMADVIRLAHPAPESREKAEFYAWLIGKSKYPMWLPTLVKDFERFKMEGGDQPPVPFEMLTSVSSVNWDKIAKNATWTQTRMNLNTFLRHGVFNDPLNVRMVMNKLTDGEQIKKSKVFPYQLMSAFIHADPSMPQQITMALQAAMEVATDNVPSIDGNVVVCVDTSGSMHNPVTGDQGSATTRVSCLDVASLITACVVRKNPNSLVLPFNDKLVNVAINPRDSVMTNAQRLREAPQGGTMCSLPLAALNYKREMVDVVIIVSDNESWLDGPAVGGSINNRTKTAAEWAILKQRCPRAKLVCIDLTPNTTAQMPQRQDVLHIGGFSDHVFALVSQFVNGESNGAALTDRVKGVE